MKISICYVREVPLLWMYSTNMHTHVYSKKYTYGTITTLFILSPDQKQSTYASSKMDKLFGCYKLNSQKKLKKKKKLHEHTKAQKVLNIILSTILHITVFIKIP